MISFVKQQGNAVYVYDEKNHLIHVKGGTLVGYTSTTFSVKIGSNVYTYDEKGHQISVH